MKRKQQTDKWNYFSTALPHEQFEALKAFAIAKDWSLSKAGRHLIRLGMERLIEQERADKTTARKKNGAGLVVDRIA